MTIINVGYRSTNYWLLTEGQSRLLIDLGWPGMAGALFANLERKGVPLCEVRYGFATHFHMDHAGAAQDLKQKSMQLICGKPRVSRVDRFRRPTRPHAWPLKRQRLAVARHGRRVHRRSHA